MLSRRRATDTSLDLHARWAAPVTDVFLGSPRAADLNGDATLDLVVTSGWEFRYGTVHAIDGATGRPLWQRTWPGKEVYSTAAVLSVDGDGIDDLIVGGRLNDVLALSGADGSTLWSLRRANPGESFDDTHFNSAIVVDDRTGDGIGELLVIQSGGQDAIRPPGWVHVIDGSDGRLLSRFQAPDGRETYSVPAVWERPDGTATVILGTGGETVPGNLYRLTLTADGNIAGRFERIAGSSKRGYVASPVLVAHGDGPPRVVTVTLDGRLAVHALSEGTPLIWEHLRAWSFMYATPAVGAFDAEPGPDVMVMFSNGPKFQDAEAGGEAIWFGGAEGRELHRLPMGHFTSMSPLVAELTGDGRDEILLTETGSGGDPSKIQTREGLRGMHTNLYLFDGNGQGELLGARFAGYSGTTPWLGDLDGDGGLDLVLASAFALYRFDLKGHTDSPRIRRGQYQGELGRGVVP